MSQVAGGSFVSWLRNQDARKDGVGELAKAVRLDPVASRLSSVQEMSKRLNQSEAPWRFHDALERAEDEWQGEALR